MTLSQEEQEEPQVKAGPTRHAKIMRGIVTPIFGLLAVACIVLGVLNATMWKPDTRIAASASVSGSRYVVTDPGVLPLVDKKVTVTAKSSSKTANVCVVIGSSRDVNGWIAGSKYTRVTGLSDWSTLAVQKASAQGKADTSEGQVELKDSDMWRETKCGTGSVSIRLKVADTEVGKDTVALIDFSDTKGASIEFDWVRQTVPDFAMPFYLVGGLFAVLAVLAASVFAMPPHKRRHRRAFAVVDGVGSSQGDDTEVAAWVRNAEANAVRNERSIEPTRKRRRHAAHSAEAEAATEETATQPTIIDPSARNLVADQQQALDGDGAGSSAADENPSAGEETSVISQEELMAYFARLAREEAAEDAAENGKGASMGTAISTDASSSDVDTSDTDASDAAMGGAVSEDAAETIEESSVDGAGEVAETSEDVAEESEESTQEAPEDSSESSESVKEESASAADVFDGSDSSVESDRSGESTDDSSSESKDDVDDGTSEGNDESENADGSNAAEGTSEPEDSERSEESGDSDADESERTDDESEETDGESEGTEESSDSDETDESGKKEAE